MKQDSEVTMLIYDKSRFDRFEQKVNLIDEKLDRIISGENKNQNDITVEWIPSPVWKEKTSTKSWTRFYGILDRMPESLKRKVGGKIYVHKDTIRLYFEGAFTDQK